jgi:hypothetical protein
MAKGKEETVETIIRIVVSVVIAFFSLALLRTNTRYARNVAVGLFTARIVLWIEEEFMDNEYYKLLLEVLAPFAAFTIIGDSFWARNASAVAATTVAANLIADVAARYYNKSKEESE